MKTVPRLNSRNRRAGPKLDRPAPATSEPLKLDFGAGPHKREGFKGVDVIAFPGVDFVTDLRQPWPWKDKSVDEANCSHLFEHFSNAERVHFLNELYRVLKPGAKCTLISPHWSSCRAYGDPTHQWPPLSEFAFFYWKKEWRMSQAPHTDISNWPQGFNCDFDVTWGYSVDPVTQTRNQEFQQDAIAHHKDVIQDCVATLVAIMPKPEGNGA